MKNNDEILISGHDRVTLFNNSILRSNILSWYDFLPGKSCAIVGEFCPIIREFLESEGLTVDALEEESFLTTGISYDYIIFLGIVNEALLQSARKILANDGALFIAVQNKNGLMNKAGVPCFKTDKAVEELKATDKIQTVEKAELVSMLKKAGFENEKFYYPYPDYRLATEIYSDVRLPKTGLVTGNYPTYEGDYLPKEDVVKLYETAVEAGQVSEVMNSFLVICGSTGVDYVKFNTLRGPKYRLTTILGLENNVPYVEKRTQGEEARGHLALLEKNREQILDNFNMIAPVEFERLNEDRVRFSFVEGKSMLSLVDFEDIVLEKLTAVVEANFMTLFSTEMDNICSFEVTDGFKEIFGDVDVAALEGADSLKVSNPDSIFDNFIISNEIYLIDYEWVFDFPVPVDYLKYRVLLYLYKENKPSFDKAGISVGRLYEALSFTEEQIIAFDAMEAAFQLKIFGEDMRYNYLPHYQWRTWDKKDKKEFMVRQLKNKLKNL